MRNSMNIVIDNYNELVKEMNDLEDKSKKVVNRTIGDFKRRAPAWVSQEVTNQYNIKKSEINNARKGTKNAGTIKVKGTRLDNISLVYQGRLLTPTHFQMKPGNRPKNGKGYVITAEIKKGQRKALSHKAFLGTTGGAGTIQIPFQRVSDNSYPIKSIKTVSIPQMITEDKVKNNIQKRISTELAKRFDYNAKRILKK